MVIEHLDIHRVVLPLRRPWKTAYGEEQSVESLLVKAMNGDGASVWVESCPLQKPTYLPETAATAIVVAENYVAPLVLGKNLEHPSEVTSLLGPIRGNSFAKAAVEMSAWALACMETGTPLHTFLGGSDDPVPVGRSFGVMPIDELIESIAAAVDDGCWRVRLKICPGHDIEVLEDVREAFPEPAIQVDCNGGYTLDDMPMFEALDELDLDMIEQPLHYRDLIDHATLQTMLETPICLDESITCPEDVESAIHIGACHAICLKPGRVGGIQPLLDILELCRANDVGCWVGGMLESDLGVAMNTELATLPGMTAAHDLTISEGRYDEVFVSPAIEYASPGLIAPTTGPWLGRQVDEELINKLSVQMVSVSA